MPNKHLLQYLLRDQHGMVVKIHNKSAEQTGSLLTVREAALTRDKEELINMQLLFDIAKGMLVWDEPDHSYLPVLLLQ
ncbi:MAG: hypothetical protein R3F37_08410 [Candidatus Competibacteraceae bacterium]